MTDIGEPNYTIPYVTPEPHCIPGYTGYIPGYGPKRIYQMAQTFGRMSHDLMSNHPVAGSRFESRAEMENIPQRQTDKRTNDAWYNENNRNNLTSRQDMIPGYTGHVPRKAFQIGTNYASESKKAAEEYEQYQRKKSDIPYMSPHQNIFPERSPRYDAIPNLYNRPQKIPLYADYRNVMNYNTSPFNSRSSGQQNRYSAPAYNPIPPGPNDDMNVPRRQQYPRQHQGPPFTGRDNERPFLNSRTNDCYCKCHESRRGY